MEDIKTKIKSRTDALLEELADYETSQFLNDEKEFHYTQDYVQNVRRQVVEAYLPKAGEKFDITDPESTNSLLATLRDMEKSTQFKVNMNFNKRKERARNETEQDANTIIGGAVSVLQAAMRARQERAKTQAQRTQPPTPDAKELDKVEVNQLAVENPNYEETDVTEFTKTIIGKGLDPRYKLDDEGNVVPRDLDKEEAGFDTQT